MTNTNPDTGIRYGVISGNSLDSDTLHELFYGSGAKDLSYEEALSELHKELVSEADSLEQEVEDDLRDEHYTANAPAPDEEQVAAALEAAWERKGYANRDDFIETEGERRIEIDRIEIDEPIIEGTYEGVKYRISWLGGAPLVWIIEGPIGYANRLCSPCVPNAADLDGGFVDGSGEGNSEDALQTVQEGFMCYVVPRDWLRQEAE